MKGGWGMSVDEEGSIEGAMVGVCVEEERGKGKKKVSKWGGGMRIYYR